MNDKFEANFEEELFVNLMNFLVESQKDKIKMIRPERYQTVMKTVARLKPILAETNHEGKIDIDLCNLFDMASISTTLDNLEITNPKAFAEMIQEADNFEIYPRTDGKIQLDITFQSVLKTIN